MRPPLLPYTGPATKVLHSIGVEYGDISYLVWTYDHEVPRSSFEWGHDANTAPPLPWATREAALRRNEEIQQQWQELRRPARPANAS